MMKYWQEDERIFRPLLPFYRQWTITVDKNSSIDEGNKDKNFNIDLKQVH